MPIPRPRNVGEILDASFRLTFRRFWLFAGLTIIPNIALVLVGLAAGGVMLVVAGPDSGFGGRGAFPAPSPDHPRLLVALAAFWGTLAVCAIPLMWLFGLFTGALESALAREAIGRNATFRESVADGRRRPWSCATVELLFTLGISCFCVPGLIMVAHFWPATAVVVLEGSSWTAAITRATDLTRGDRWRCLGVWLLMWLIPQMIAVPLMSPFSARDLIERVYAIPDWLEWLFIVLYGVGFVLSQVLHVFTRAAQVLYYLDLRVRKEGLDLAPAGGAPGGRATGGGAPGAGAAAPAAPPVIRGAGGP